MLAVVAPEALTVGINELTGRIADAAVAGQKTRAARPGQEAEVLRVRLARHRQPGAGGDLAHLRLGQVPEREAHPGQRCRRQCGQHVGLVLGRVGGGAQQRSAGILVLGRAGVVTGGQPVGPEPLGQREHRVQAHVAVAAHARVGGLARRVAVDERLHDPGAEGLAQVQGEVRHAHPVREGARLGHGAGRAAAALCVVLGV